ncbi:MAG: NAD(P)H-dependent oxidoreductase [Gemmatimonadetes bacterium]|nr:NAD(P)H-dependent oxidoreductase [Gemmatimonadota bacterium]MCH7715775.1 NAD(P)H-dependent oxidoreductase [Gemmatimonadota bacterium]
MTNDSVRISIAIVKGSVRPNNYTSKATALVVDELERQPDVDVQVIDPGVLNLALPGMTSEGSREQELQATIRNAGGVILATPEYHGSFSSVMKLVIENLGFPSVLSGKPVALLGVAAGRIGAIKSLEHLRSVVSHIGGIVLPGPVSVAGVRGYFDEAGQITDPATDKAIRSVATNLLTYVRSRVCEVRCLEEMVRGKAA